MAIKKSELYSSLWASCDALRGGMDASQYKDYVLILLFVKYVSDKYANDPDALIEIPAGSSFKDIAAAKGHKDIGEKIDTTIGALAKANDLEKIIDIVSFNDEEKLGKGKEMVDRLSELVAIFENPALDFSRNRAEGDDILGDAYEYLMRHFATESGKSKGQFYTPAEVSRIMAKVIGVREAAQPRVTIYDPTCGSGSLLLKAADEATGTVSIYGQEKDVATAALARMNMILHNNPTAEIAKGQSTLSNPHFHDEHAYLKAFDFVVANPPFSSKNWTQGFLPNNDEFGRFTGYGIPPEKNGDFAFLLHILKSLKSTGKGAVILPHGVLFRGNAEAEIRRNLLQKGYIKGIIGLPANLFYGTGIPACIIVLDKEQAAERQGIFMIDASKGFIKDGNKNRLREQDIHKIVDAFTNHLELPKYSRLVPLAEIADAKNDYNLNLPRYIDTQEPEDLQNIEAHLLGGIPLADLEALSAYWQVYPQLRSDLFAPGARANCATLGVPLDQLKQTIFNHPEFVAFSQSLDQVFSSWKTRTVLTLQGLAPGFKPKLLIQQIAEDLLQSYSQVPLIDKYDVYQHLLDYWTETMQDDAYIIATDGWKAEVYRVLVENKKREKVDKGWACDLVPASLVAGHFFAAEQAAVAELEAAKEAAAARLEELEEEHGGEEGFFAELEKVNKATVLKRLREIKTDRSASEERKVLEDYLSTAEQLATLAQSIKTATADLDKRVLAKYPTLSTADIQHLVIEAKWMQRIEAAVGSEMDRISQRLTQRIRELAERYATPLPRLLEEVEVLEEKVNAHLWTSSKK
jgi:type I restriction enzyme M protein